jgi:hypothetical protein
MEEVNHLDWETGDDWNRNTWKRDLWERNPKRADGEYEQLVRER